MLNKHYDTTCLGYRLPCRTTVQDSGLGYKQIGLAYNIFITITNIGYNTLLKPDVTRRDHVSVVMDPMNVGSRIVTFIANFIRDGTVFA